MHKMAK